MINKGLVTVIIPVYNVFPYLGEALDSVLNQSYENLEVIIVDDGSTDGSEMLCDDYAKNDHRIYVIHQENKGLSVARNVGLNIMRGEMIAFLDSDDVYHHKFISLMVDAMYRENVDLVVCKYTSYGRKIRENINCPSELYCRKTALQSLIEQSIEHVVWNKLYRSSLWTNIRYPEGHIYEDVDTTFRLIDHCQKVLVLGETLYFKRKRSQSITETVSKRHMDDWLLAYSHLETFVYNNTPEVFNSQQVARFQQTKLNKLIRYYMYFSLGKDVDGIDYENLKQQIYIAGSNVRVKNLGVRMLLCYYMIIYSPCFFRLIYSIYNFGCRFF